MGNGAEKEKVKPSERQIASHIVFGLFILPAFVFGLFFGVLTLINEYGSADAKAFYRNAVRRLHIDNEVYVRDLVEFQWDKVCYVPEYDLRPPSFLNKVIPQLVGLRGHNQSYDEMKRSLGGDFKSYNGGIPNTDSMFIRFALSFVKDGEVVKIFTYGKAVGDIKVNGHRYEFLEFSPAYCAVYEEAVLNLQDGKGNDLSGKVLLTSKGGDAFAKTGE